MFVFWLFCAVCYYFMILGKGNRNDISCTMTRPFFGILRHRCRNAILLLVGIATSCLVFLALSDNLSGLPLSETIQSQFIITTQTDVRSTDIFRIRTVKLNNNDTRLFARNLKRLSFIRRDSIRPNWNRVLYYNVSSTPEVFLRWRSPDGRQDICDDRMVAYDNEFLEARDIVVDKTFFKCVLKGGELINSVMNQDEMAEYYELEPGSFQIRCSEPSSYFFNGENHLNKWMTSFMERDVTAKVDHVVTDFTIAVTRYEYANLYHTTTDWYNAFLVMQFFNRTSFDTNILIVDAHPSGALDPVWSHLFNSTIRLAGLAKRTQFKQLVWGILGYNSLMRTYVSPTPPLLEEFRDFFLSAYDINSRRQIDCTKLSILFVWRRNYLAHPRNPTGFVGRRIYNEEQLVNYIRRKNSNSMVTGVQIDLFSMRQQLQLIANTDILIGMHGAGLTHAVFLPKRSALIELVPNYWSPMAEHFMTICIWRSLVYRQWFNSEQRDEYPEQMTRVPPRVMNALIKNTIRELCVS